MMLNLIHISIVLLVVVAAGCAPKIQPSPSEVYQMPPEVYTFSVPADSISREIKEKKPEILKDFPFVSYHPATDFRGKYPPEFYSQFKSRWKAESLKAADIWRLRHDPNYYDVLYAPALWIGNLTLKGQDFMKVIAGADNLPDEQLAVIEEWVRQGGTLWFESAIYISAYDYSLSQFTDAKLDDMVRTLSGMKLFGNAIRVNSFKARKIDEFHTDMFVSEVIPEETTDSQAAGITRDVKKLLLEQSDYVGIYFTIEGSPLIQAGGTVYASSAEYGKGKVITLAPFDFRNARYDGEMLRFDMMSWIMNVRR